MSAGIVTQPMEEYTWKGRKCCNLWCSHCDVSGSTTVVTYDGCIKNHERSENFPTMNERVARELIRAFQHSHSR